VSKSATVRKNSAPLLATLRVGIEGAVAGGVDHLDRDRREDADRARRGARTG
jgi:hypothetical protein